MAGRESATAGSTSATAGSTSATAGGKSSESTKSLLDLAIIRVDKRESVGPMSIESRDEYTEIKNVSLVEKDPVYSVALKEWDRKRALYEERVDRREKNVTDLNNHVFNIVGFFSVFQGVVLTTVTQLKSDKHDTCGIIWFPIALSIVALVASVYGISLKFSNLTKLEKSIEGYSQSRQKIETWANRLREQGKDNFFFHKHMGEVALDLPNYFSMSRIVVLFGMFIFTILLIMSYLAILCDFMDFLHLKGGFGAVGRAPTPAA